MKANELMIGDLVFVNGTPRKVCAITKRKIGYHRDGFLDCTRLFYAVLREVTPIHITAEFLEKNGFKDYTEIREYQFEEDGEGYRFYLKKMYNKDNVCDAWGTNIGGVLPSIIRYVHELQHALRLCGLNDLADNLKL